MGRLVCVKDYNFQQLRNVQNTQKNGPRKIWRKKLCVVRLSDVILWDQSSGEGADREAWGPLIFQNKNNCVFYIRTLKVCVSCS